MRQTRAILGAVFSLAFVLATGAYAEEWFDAYENGLKALRNRQAARAAEHFERAIRLRAEPGVNVITYGTNRLDRYHPYLKLAEAYLLAGEPDKAKDALRRSEARGREPSAERARMGALVEAAIERARVAAATPAPTPPPVTQPPPPTTVAAAVPTPAPTLPPTTVAAAPPSSASLAPQTGTLELRSDPDGATVLLDGRLLGRTPLRVDLAPGVYPVVLRKEGAADLAFSVKVEGGRRTTETRSLPAAPAEAPSSPSEGAVASVIVYAEPPGAAVYLDDEPLGVTDPRSGRLVKSGVSPGVHGVRFALAGHEDLSQDVEVKPGQAATLRVKLTPLSAQARVPWGIVALGVVVVGGLVVYAVRSRRGRETGRGGTVALPPRGARTPPRSRTPTVTPRATRSSALDDLVEIETQAIPASGPGEAFGEYVLLEPLGKGGMATVYKAERRGDLCALKRPLQILLDDPEFLERFLREAEIGRTLHHPNIIRIFERGEVKGVPYFTMELVVGETLQARLRRDGAMAPKVAARLIAQVAEALDYAHLKGVVHRDLKPSNIMVLEDGTAKVMDYGIARARRFEGLTVTGAFLGTPDYVAPETAEGKGADGRSDLYSLGIVFYEILTGKKPFVGDTPFATLRKHCTEPPTPPSAVAPGTPRELEAIILKLLRKEPAERYPGAEELLIELRDYVNRAA